MIIASGMHFTIQFRDSPLGASFPVRIQPKAAANAVTGTHAGSLKISVSAPPAENRANEALIEFVADLFRVPRSAVQILSGLHSRQKVLRIAGRSARELELALQGHFRV